MDKGTSKKTRTTTKKKPTRPLIKLQFNPNYIPSKGEENTMPSLTRPDMSLSILTLLTNHSRGISSDVHEHRAQFFGVEIPKFDDITEEIAYKEELLEQARQIQLTADEEITAKRKYLKDTQKAAKEKAILDAQELLNVPPTPPEEA